jgi:ferredoxin-NADP reductase
MARAAVLGRLTWLAGQLAAVREETATAQTLVLDVPGWASPVRRLDARRLHDLAGPPAAGQQCFICGPTGFVESAANLLVEQGLGDRQIRTERFGRSGGTP